MQAAAELSYVRDSLHSGAGSASSGQSFHIQNTQNIFRENRTFSFTKHKIVRGFVGNFAEI